MKKVYIFVCLMLMFNLKLKKMKDKILKILNWVITIATALTVFIDKLPLGS